MLGGGGECNCSVFGFSISFPLRIRCLAAWKKVGSYCGAMGNLGTQMKVLIIKGPPILQNVVV